MFASGFSVSSDCLKPAMFAAAVMLAGCSGQSSNSASVPASTGNDPSAAPAQPQNSMSVAELTSGTASAPASPTSLGVSLGPSTSPTAPPSAGSPAPVSEQIASAQPIDDAQFARVISVQALTQPQRICSNQTVTERRRPEDRHRVAGTVIGAIAGAVIGSKIGHGGGRNIATVGGAVGGGIVGNKIQQSHQDNDMVTRVVQRCHTVTPGKDVAALYDVVYAYQGQNFHARLDYDPGDRIALPVRGIE